MAVVTQRAGLVPGRTVLSAWRPGLRARCRFCVRRPTGLHQHQSGARTKLASNRAPVVAAAAISITRVRRGHRRAGPQGSGACGGRSCISGRDLLIGEMTRDPRFPFLCRPADVRIHPPVPTADLPSRVSPAAVMFERSENSVPFKLWMAGNPFGPDGRKLRRDPTEFLAL